VTKAEMDSEMVKSPDAPQRGLIPVPQVHQAPLCSASGSKLKGLMGRAPYPHADAAFCPIGKAFFANGGMPQNHIDMGLFVPSDAMNKYVIGLAIRPAASAKLRGACCESSAL
jgi:hypothetical protein